MFLIVEMSCQDLYNRLENYEYFVFLRVEWKGRNQNLKDIG